jgi:hypothetical protein
MRVMWRRLLLICFVALVGWLAAIAEAGIGLLREVDALQALRWQTPIPLSQALDHADRAAERAIALGNRASPLRYPLALFGWVPQVGSLLSQAGPLMDAATDLSHAGRQAINLARPALDTLLMPSMPSPDAPAIDGLVSAALVSIAGQSAAAPWVADEIRARLDAAEVGLSAVDTSAMPDRIAGLLNGLRDGLRLAEPGSAALPYLRDLLGAARPAHYLVVLQNTDERRATGGFLSAVALITLDKGRVGPVEFRDSYLENTRDEPTLTRILSTYPPAPDAMQDLLYLPVQVFRDSNWEPDVRLSGEVILDRYERATGVRPDGVVLITPEVALSLVDVLQPLILEDGTAITRDNLLTFMRDSFARPREVDLEAWYRNRKEIYNQLARVVLARLGGDLPDARLVPTALRLLDEKQLLTYVRFPALQAALEERGWAGAMKPPAGDYLMLVDSNVGFNKANALVETRIAYEVDLRPRFYTAVLRVAFAHRGVARVERCVQYTGYAFFEDLTYTAISDRCYYGFLRAYVPYISDPTFGDLPGIPGASMDDGQPRSGALRAERRDPYTLFSWLALVFPGSSIEQEIRYILPATVVQGNRYVLDVQKQPGTGAIPLAITIRLPPGARVIESPAPAAQEGGAVVIRTDLSRDRRVVIDLAAGR